MPQIVSSQRHARIYLQHCVSPNVFVSLRRLIVYMTMRVLTGTLTNLVSSCRRQPSLEKVFGAKITLCGDIIGHRIKSRSLFAEALNTCKEEEAGKVFVDGQRTIIPHNARLAIYGDAIIRAHLSRLWYIRGPDTCKRVSPIC